MSRLSTEEVAKADSAYCYWVLQAIVRNSEVTEAESFPRIFSNTMISLSTHTCVLEG